MKNRIIYIDIAKGIGILLVIVGHTVTSNVLRGIIFSFHMPLFFIASGVTSHCSKSKQEYIWRLRKSFVHLVIMAIVLYCARTMILCIQGREVFDLEKMLLSVFFFSGSKVTIFQTTVKAVGMVWFLIVFFSYRVICDGISLLFGESKQSVAIMGFMTVLGVAIGHIAWLPFSFDIALAVSVFFCIGKLFEKNDAVARLRDNPRFFGKAVLMAGGGYNGGVYDFEKLSRTGYKGISAVPV